MSRDTARQEARIKGGPFEVAASVVAVIPTCQFDRRRNCDAPEMPGRKSLTVDFSV